MSNYPFPCLCLSPFHLIPFSFLIFLLSTPSFSCSLLHPSSLAPQSKSHFMLFLNCTQPPSTLAVIPPPSPQVGGVTEGAYPITKTTCHVACAMAEDSRHLCTDCLVCRTINGLAYTEKEQRNLNSLPRLLFFPLFSFSFFSFSSFFFSSSKDAFAKNCGLSKALNLRSAWRHLEIEKDGHTGRHR